jgi:AcrR family transcriptional regulator
MAIQRTKPPAANLRAARPRSLTSAEPADEATSVAHVRDGVFFTLPAALPRGRHKLTREQVRSAQRERLLAAMTELLATHGYRGFGPGDVASRAGVSLAAFYDCFENLDACVFAGYDRFIEVLLTRMTAVDTTQRDRSALVKAVLGAYLETLQSDLVVARAYQVEIDALGPAARARRRDSLKLFATFIRELLARTSPNRQPPELPRTAYVGVVYATRQLAADALDEAPEPDLTTLGDDLEPWVADLFRQRDPSA